VYDSLSGLVKKGLASYSLKGKTTYYHASEPARLRDFILEKEKSLQEVLPALSSIYRSYPAKPSVQIYEGNEGIKTVLSDIVNEGKELLGFGVTNRIFQLFPDTAKRYMRERKKKKIYSRQLCAEGSKTISSALTTYRTTPKEFSGPAATYIYGDRVVIMLWSTGIPIAVMIKSKDAAHAYKNYFEFVWKMVGNKKDKRNA
jgi:sugar-specific transcriptional regulator TrmB